MGCFCSQTLKSLFTLSSLPLTWQCIGAENNGLVFSPKLVVLFDRKNKIRVKGELSIDGSKLPFSDEISYLGLILNWRLNFNLQISKKINKCKGKLCSIRSVLDVRWGPSPRMLLWAFQRLILPSLMYRAMVWGHQNLNGCPWQTGAA